MIVAVVVAGGLGLSRLGGTAAPARLAVAEAPTSAEPAPSATGSADGATTTGSGGPATGSGGTAIGTGGPATGSGGTAIGTGARGPDATPVPATTFPIPSASAATDPALLRWADFPIGESPRQPIFTGETVLIPRSGFNPGVDKEAFLADKFQTPALSDQTSTADGYPVISSRAAWNLLLAQGSPTNPAADAPTLHVGPLHLGSASFVTDRGKRTLPAWLTRIDGLSGAVAIAAVQPRISAQPDPVPTDVGAYLGVGSGGATLSRDGRTLSFPVSGVEHPTVCDLGLPTVGVEESATAVELKLIEPAQSPPTPSPADPAGGSVSCADVAVSTTISVRLDTPLGNRVLIDQDGDAVTVTG